MNNLKKLIEDWSSQFSETVEMMTGAPAHVTSGGSAEGSAELWWENAFSLDPELKLTVGADRNTWMSLASEILRAAGIEPIEEQEARSTWLEVVEQTASSTARKLSADAPKAVECSAGRVVTDVTGSRHQVSVSVGGQSYPVLLILSANAAKPEQSAVVAPADRVTATTPAPALPHAVSRTMEALLEVQLPVSISFGQARIPLRDVLKLTTGSVVELNRQPEDAVDIIVNDCVIARGEVVVVEGNYAVRIQSIVGRQQRIGLRPGSEHEGHFH